MRFQIMEIGLVPSSGRDKFGGFRPAIHFAIYSSVVVIDGLGIDLEMYRGHWQSYWNLETFIFHSHVCR